MTRSAVADAKPWPAWLCPSGHLASQLLPLDDVPEEKEPDDGQEEKEKHDDDDDETEKHDDDEEDEEHTHKKAAVAAKLAQDEEEARAQAAVAAKRQQAATLEGCVHLGKVKQKAVDLHWWKRGVHQIVVWMGTARRGKGSRKGSGKGKGAGAAVAERYPKGNRKGNKW